MKLSSAGQSWRAAGCISDVFVFHRDLIVGSDHLYSPIVIAVAAASGVGRFAADVVAGECNALVRVEAEDTMLAAGASSLMILVSERVIVAA
jgi:hypothetical protein